MTPEHRAELSKLEDLAGDISREYHQYIEKIARPIKGGAAGERAFLCLLAIRKHAETTKPKLGRPAKVAA